MKKILYAIIIIQLLQLSQLILMATKKIDVFFLVLSLLNAAILAAIGLFEKE